MILHNSEGVNMEFVKEEPGVAPEPHSVSAENESQVLVSSTEEGEDDGVSFYTPVWLNCQYFRYFYLFLTNVSLYFLSLCRIRAWCA